MTAPFEQTEIHLRDYLYILRKRRIVILVFLSLVLVFGTLFTYFEKMLYRAQATVLIERENPNVVDFKEVITLDTSTTDFYRTQYQIMESRSLIERLIQEENLETDPYLGQLQKGVWRRALRDQRFLPHWLNEFLAEAPLTDLFVKKMLRIEPVRNSRLVRVSVLYPDPDISAHLTNRLVELFIQKSLEDRYLVSKQATDLLSHQLVELKEKVGAAERKLQDYKEKQGLVNIPSIREKDEFIQEAKLELVKIQAEESKLARRYLPAHPKRIHIRSQIEGLEEKIEQEEQKTLEFSRAAIEYSELERETETARKIYEALLARLGETQSEAQTQASNIMIVDRAKPPTRPFKPRPFLNMIIALFCGVTGGILLAFFSEYLDPNVKIPEDIEKALGLDLLGIIPVEARLRKGSARAASFFSSGDSSPAAESFRALRTALLFRLRSITGGRTILVTSPNPEEGKSTVVLNLAVAFRQNYSKVLLLDADLRRPNLHKILNLPSEKGLTEILEGELPFREVVHKNIADLGFDFISCGASSHHPTEILGTQAMKEFLEEMKASYDILLIDSPPYLPVADVAVLSEYADAMVVVARYHKTNKGHLRGLRRRFGHNEKKMMGVVINQVSVREKDYYFHQYYYYGYGDAPRKK